MEDLKAATKAVGGSASDENVAEIVKRIAGEQKEITSEDFCRIMSHNNV